MIDLREEFEDSAELVRGEADARISDSDHRLVAFFLDREPNATAPVRELAGVVEQVADHLRQPNRGLRRRNRGLGGSVTVIS